jgi:hypothetical protein
MPSVLFHASGKDFDIRSLDDTGLNPYRVYQVGERARSGRRGFIYEDSGFSIDLGPDDKEDLNTQIEAASAFLGMHGSTISQLAGLDEMRFDFGYIPRKGKDGLQIMVQCDYFPAEFLRECGNLGIGIELSLYLVSEPGEEAAPPSA